MPSLSLLHSKPYLLSKYHPGHSSPEWPFCLLLVEPPVVGPSLKRLIRSPHNKEYQQGDDPDGPHPAPSKVAHILVALADAGVAAVGGALLAGLPAAVEVFVFLAAREAE